MQKEKYQDETFRLRYPHAQIASSVEDYMGTTRLVFVLDLNDTTISVDKLLGAGYASDDS